MGKYPLIFVLGLLSFAVTSAWGISFEGDDIPHRLGMRDVPQSQQCARDLKKAAAARREVTVHIQIDPSAETGVGDASQWFTKLSGVGVDILNWSADDLVVEGTVPASKLNSLSRLKFIQFIDRFDDFGWSQPLAKMDAALQRALQVRSTDSVRMRLRVHLDPDGKQFAFRQLVKKLSVLPGNNQVLKVTRPTKAKAGLILFEAERGWVERVVRFLPGDLRRSWAELDESEVID